MTTIRRFPRSKLRVIPSILLIFLFFLLVVYLAVVSSPTQSPYRATEDYAPLSQNVSASGQGIRTALARKREQVQHTLHNLADGNLPQRLRTLRDRHQIVGERLSEVQAGKETVQEILHGHDMKHHTSSKPPLEFEEVVVYLDTWIHKLHEKLLQVKRGTSDLIWEAYHDLVVKTLYPWDRDYLMRMPKRRDDGSIFLSVATYRDENCFNTVYNAYAKAKFPENLFIGLVQQNCHEHCKSGVLANLSMVPVPPDDDCYAKFCETELGKPICKRKQVRLLNINEPESLGPYAARYFASKLWYGEQWYMQIDAHMSFATDWDATSIAMLKKAPSSKPVLSHYPEDFSFDFDNSKKEPAERLCGPVFATSDIEAQIVRLEGAGYDEKQLEYPAFAPFTAAGYFVAHSDFLREVPFDPFLPWIFMGEEIIMSSRLWTAGYDIFSPTENVVGHIYVRQHRPKFWESVNRAFSMDVHNPLQIMVLDRIKYQLGYPESARDMLSHKTILTAVEQYSMGKARPLEEYLRIIGLNMTTKEATQTGWCETGKPPPGMEKYNHLYPAAKGG